MKLTTNQVAEKLGITSTTVRALSKSGSLHDVAVRKKGASRHFSHFDSKEVNEFAKTYKKNSRAHNHTNGEVTAPLGLKSQLDRLETKELDKLIGIWS